MNKQSLFKLATIGSFLVALVMGLLLPLQSVAMAGKPNNTTVAADTVAYFPPTAKRAQLITGTSTNIQSQDAVTTPLDVVVVLDVSGSMEYETNCYGCWEKNDSLDDTPEEVMQYPYPLNGSFHPLNYYEDSDIFWYDSGGTMVASHNVCGLPPQAYQNAGYHYLVHEAEFYSADVPLHGWEFDRRSPGQGFWVMQRTGRGSNEAFIRPHPFPTYSQTSLRMDYVPQLQGAAYNAECFNGSSLSGECWRIRALALGESAPSNVPWVEYDFTPDWDGSTYIWIRAVGGTNHAFEWSGATATVLNQWRKSIYWQVDENDVRGGEYSNLQVGDWDGPNSDNDWRWLKLGFVSTISGTQHVLKLYQGSAGFNVDKIIFTNNADGSVNSAVTNTGGEYGAGIGNDLENVLTMNSGRGPDATLGSATREACNMCNPAFGKTVEPASCTCRVGPGDTTSGTGLGCTGVLATTNMLQNDLFHGEYDPMRSAQEAVKKFVAQLDPQSDQVGLVGFSTNIAVPRVKLQCLSYAQRNLTGELECYDVGMTPISFTHVLWAIEQHRPSGSTNIATGVSEGLEELGFVVEGYTDQVLSGFASSCNKIGNWAGYRYGDGKPCDRAGLAQRVLILMTDGSPNQSIPCPAGYNWRGVLGSGRNTYYDCAMYFAEQAAKNDVAVFTIGIGPGGSPELLTAMATGTDPHPAPGDDGYYFDQRCGNFYAAPSPADIDDAFTAILAQARTCAQAATPDVTVTKAAPETVIAGSPVTYTLTLTNNRNFNFTNLLVTDVVPAGATYISGGSSDGQVVSWTVPVLPLAGGVAQTTFVVTASQTLTNQNYWVRPNGGYSIPGEVNVITLIFGEGSEPGGIFLPVILKY